MIWIFLAMLVFWASLTADIARANRTLKGIELRLAELAGVDPEE